MFSSVLYYITMQVLGTKQEYNHIKLCLRPLVDMFRHQEIELNYSLEQLKVFSSQLNQQYSFINQIDL